MVPAAGQGPGQRRGQRAQQEGPGRAAEPREGRGERDWAAGRGRGGRTGTEGPGFSDSRVRQRGGAGSGGAWPEPRVDAAGNAATGSGDRGRGGTRESDLEEGPRGARSRGSGAGRAGPEARCCRALSAVLKRRCPDGRPALPQAAERGPRSARARAPSVPRRSAPPGARPPQALSIFPCPAPQILQPRSLPQRLMRRRAAARHRLSQGSRRRADPLPDRRREQQEAQLSASV